MKLTSVSQTDKLKTAAHPLVGYIQKVLLIRKKFHWFFSVLVQILNH